MKVLQIITELLIVAACINAGLAAPVPSTPPRQAFHPRSSSDESGESYRRAFVTKEAAHVNRCAEMRAHVTNVEEYLQRNDHSFRSADLGKLFPRFRPRHSAGQLHPPKPGKSLEMLFSRDHTLSRRKEELDARFGSIFGYGPITLCRKSLWTLFWRRSKYKTEEEEAEEEEEPHNKCLIHLPLFGEPKKSFHHPDKRGRKSDDHRKSSTSSTSSNSTHLAEHHTKSPNQPDKRGQEFDDDRKSPTSSTKASSTHLTPRPRSSPRRRALTTAQRMPQDRTQVSTEASAVFFSDLASFALWLARLGWIALPDTLEQPPLVLLGADASQGPTSFRVPRSGLWRRALTTTEKANVVASERREVTLKRSLSSAASMARTTLNNVARAISALSTRSRIWHTPHSHLSGGNCGHSLGFGPQHRSRAVSFLTSKFSLPDGTWMCRRDLGRLPRSEEDALARRSTRLPHDLSEAHLHTRDGSLAQASANGRRDAKLAEGVKHDLARRDHGPLTNVDRRRDDLTRAGQARWLRRASKAVKTFSETIGAPASHNEGVVSGKHKSIGKSRHDSDWLLPDSSFWRRGLSIIEQYLDLGQRSSKAVLSSWKHGARFGSEQRESSDLLFDARQSWTVEADTTPELGASLDGAVRRIDADMFEVLEHRWDDIKLFARAITLSHLPAVGTLRGKTKKPKHGVVATIFGVPMGDWPSLVHRSGQDA